MQKIVGIVREVIQTASVSKKPTPAALTALIQPLQLQMEATIAIKDKNRPSPLFGQLSAIAEGIPGI